MIKKCTTTLSSELEKSGRESGIPCGLNLKKEPELPHLSSSAGFNVFDSELSWLKVGSRKVPVVGDSCVKIKSKKN